MASKRKILIVDDNKELCMNLSDILELKGCKAVIANDGYQAIEAVKDDNFNVVLLDIKMPGMNGVDVLKILRKIVPDLVIVMITAFADDISYKEDLKDMNLKIIEKPINIDKLLAIIGDIC